MMSEPRSLLKNLCAAMMSLSCMFWPWISKAAELNLSSDIIEEESPALDSQEISTAVWLDPLQEKNKPLSESTGKLPVAQVESKKAVSTSLGIDSGVEAHQTRSRYPIQHFWQWIDVSVKYKFADKKSSLSFTHGFDYYYNAFQPEKGQNRYNPYLPGIRYSLHTPGVLGSNELSPSIRYYFPASYNRMAAESKMLGIIGADVSPEWNLSTRWATSYYFSTKANLVSRENRWKDENDQTHQVPTAIRVLQGPSLDYHLSEPQRVYASVLLDQMVDYNNSMNLSQKIEFKPDAHVTDNIYLNKMYLSTGFNQSLKFKKTQITLNPYLMKIGDLRHDYQFKSADDNSADTQWWNRDNLTYNLYFEVCY